LETGGTGGIATYLVSTGHGYRCLLCGSLVSGREKESGDRAELQQRRERSEEVSVVDDGGAVAQVRANLFGTSANTGIVQK
jgi:hypothetical protein